MIRRRDCEYLTLDGMPFVVDPFKRNWVFARTTKRWEEHGPDDFDAVYIRSGEWDKIFAKLPDLPKKAFRRGRGRTREEFPADSFDPAEFPNCTFPPPYATGYTIGTDHLRDKNSKKKGR